MTTGRVFFSREIGQARAMDEEEFLEDDESYLLDNVSKREARMDLLELVGKGGAGKSSHTRATYVNRLGVLRDRYFAKVKKREPAIGDHTWIAETDGVSKFIEDEWTVSFETRKLSFESLIAALKQLPGADYERAIEIYREHMAKLSSLSDNRYISQSMSESEREKWMEWSEIEKAVSEHRNAYWPRLASKTTWTEDDFRQFQEILLTSVYTMLPPLR